VLTDCSCQLKIPTPLRWPTCSRSPKSLNGVVCLLPFHRAQTRNEFKMYIPELNSVALVVCSLNNWSCFVVLICSKQVSAALPSVPIDLDLWLFDLQIILPVAPDRVTFPVSLNIVCLSVFELRRHRMDGWTDRRTGCNA